MTPYQYARAAEKNLGLSLDGDQLIELARLFQLAIEHATATLTEDRDRLRVIGHSLLYHDERGQGVGWRQAMEDLRGAIPFATSSPKPTPCEVGEGEARQVSTAPVGPQTSEGDTEK